MLGQKGMPALHGGVERHVHELSMRLVLRGHEAIVYSRTWYSPEKPASIHGVRQVYTPSIHTKHLDTITHTFFSVLHAMKENVDVYHFHGVGPSLFAWLPRLFRPKARVISTFHSIDRKHEKWGKIARTVLALGERASCTFAHETVTVSEGIHNYARDRFDQETTLIHNAVPLYDRTERTTKIDRFGIESQKYVMVVSRLIAHKGITYLIDTWKQLRKAKKTAKMKLVIVGDGHYSDSYVDMLHKMAEGDDSIVFTGFQSGDALAQLYSHAKLFVHPSDNEGLPLSVLEAMSYGLPVLVSDIDGHKDLIRHPSFTFEKSSTKALKAKMSRMLSGSADRLVKEGQRNRDKVAKEFSWDQAVDAFEAVYEGPVRGQVAIKVA